MFWNIIVSKKKITILKSVLYQINNIELKNKTILIKEKSHIKSNNAIGKRVFLSNKKFAESVCFDICVRDVEYKTNECTKYQTSCPEHMERFRNFEKSNQEYCFVFDDFLSRALYSTRWLYRAAKTI